MRNVGRPPPDPQSSRTIHNGTTATRRAAEPDWTHCSAQTTAPFPPRSMRPPETTATLRSRRLNMGAPRARARSQSNTPADVNRAPAMRKGGRSSTA